MNSFDERNDILPDEYEMLATEIAKSVAGRHNKQLLTGDFYFLGDSSFLCDYLLRSVAMVCAKRSSCGMGTVTYIRSGNEDDRRAETLTDLQKLITAKDQFNSLSKTDQVFVFVDCIGGLAARETTIKRLNDLSEVLEKSPVKKVIVTVLMPQIPAFPEKITALSEREMDYFLSKKCEHTPELDYYLELGRLFRAMEAKTNADINVLCFSNVFAPDRYHLPDLDLAGIVDASFKNGRVHIPSNAFGKTICLTYVRNACWQAFSLLTVGKKGHLYHGQGAILTTGKIMQLLHEIYADRLALSSEATAVATPRYHVPDHLKLSLLEIEDICSMESALRHIVSYRTGLEYDMTESVAFYQGKIETIQALEIEILREIDRICRKHNIHYFLAGGTLLGSVRDGSPIKWDDDLDIGMLRDDYEKFRKVCESELEDRFLFSGIYNHSGNHYTIEKIRLKNTWFSTQFSSQNVFDDGVFVDVLIYDRTTKGKLGQKLQIWFLAVMTTLIYIRWYNEPRPNYHYRFSKIALPFLRLIPWRVYHGLFELAARRYRCNKKTDLLIDTVGKKLMDGPLPIEGLTEVKDVEFAGMIAETPTDPVPYLNYAYGPNYMQKPVVSKRRCPHNFARIDLGGYVFGEMHPDYRDADLRGELFEKD